MRTTSSRPLKVLLLGCAAAVSVCASPARAQTYVYQDGQVDPFGPIVLTQDSSLVVSAEAASATQSSPISGPFGISKGGAGTLVLTGANTYTGRTDISGTLALGNGGATGSIANTSLIFSNGVLQLNRSDRLVVATEMRGAGNIWQIGSGVTVLTNDNVFATGGVVIQNGVLQFGDGGTTGAFPGRLLSNIVTQGSGVLAINHSNDFQLVRSVIGSGSLHQDGTGTTIISGDNTYTGGTVISAGALQIGRGGAGSIVGNVIDNATLIFASGGRANFDGVISGTGQVIKRDPSELTLTGASTYTGPTIIEEGRLIVNGSLVSTVTVNPSARLSGSGSVGGAIVHGALAPGNPVVADVFTINGPLTFGADGVYIVDVVTAGADRVNVGGVASLAGTLRLLPAVGPYTGAVSYTLLSATGGRTGKFGTVETQGSFGPDVRWFIAYTANSVVLNVLPDDLSFLLEQGATTQNERNVAVGIDRAVAAGGDPSPFFALYSQPSGALGPALASLSGEIHVATASSVAPVAEQFLGVMLNPFAADGRRVTRDERGLILWGAAFGSTGRSDGDVSGVGSTHGDSHDGQLAFGVDIHPNANALFGAAIAAGTNDLSLARDQGRAKSDTLEFGVYGLGRIGKLYLAGAVSHGVFDTDTHRAIPVFSLSDVSAKYDLKAWSAQLDASIAVIEGKAGALAPIASLRWVSVESPDIKEEATVTETVLQVAGRTSDNARAELGLRATTGELVGSDKVAGFVQAGWGYYLERDRAMTARFIGLPGSDMTILGSRPPRNVALIAGGLDLKLGAGTTVSAGADGEVGSGFNRVSGWVRLRAAF